MRREVVTLTLLTIAIAVLLTVAVLIGGVELGQR